MEISFYFRIIFNSMVQKIGLCDRVKMLSKSNQI